MGQSFSFFSKQIDENSIPFDQSRIVVSAKCQNTRLPILNKDEEGVAYVRTGTCLLDLLNEDKEVTS